MIARQKRYNRTRVGLAVRLRYQYGLDRETSEYWAIVLTANQSRCRICGVPNWFLRKQGIWKIGGANRNRNLSFDHITPGVNDGNFRELCLSCNRTRDKALFTDAEVLEKMREWYQWAFPNPRFLRWLNTSPGQGGKPYRSDYVAKQAMEFDGGPHGGSEGVRSA